MSHLKAKRKLSHSPSPKNWGQVQSLFLYYWFFLGFCGSACGRQTLFIAIDDGSSFCIIYWLSGGVTAKVVTDDYHFGGANQMLHAPEEC